MKTVDFLEHRKKETLEIISSVKKEFAELDPNKFNTKPSPEKWSIAECFIHLNQTLDIYIPQMVKKVKDKEKYKGQNEFFKYSLVGRMAVRSMLPRPDKSIAFRMKTFGNLKPKRSEGERDKILNEFLGFQTSIIHVIEGLDGLSLTKPKIITAAGSILKMCIGDALHFMIAHNQRHILQAQNVLKIIS
ncbi:MAG: DinB family protein [Cytophagales bacterium]|nr:DinB family protein [Cytophagales bacterium]